MTKNTEPDRNDSNPITANPTTLPYKVDLSRYDSLPLSFTDRDGKVLIKFESRRQSEDSVEVVVSATGPTGDVVAAFTLFDLKV
ncbi:MAG: hypothetical protein DMF61_11370 [Blastocatellia bacterium AA13]|nr:MAG: hypothetical protein DMF61_11370 [Blastocatellia bacterium AA13]